MGKKWWKGEKKVGERLWLKMSDIQKKLDHTNVTKLIKRELKGIYGKKIKILQIKKKKRIRHFLWPYWALHCWKYCLKNNQVLQKTSIWF